LLSFEKKVHATLVEVPSGGHYDSMIQEGIPAGIKWLKGLGLLDR
jgi:hypothetical protein